MKLISFILLATISIFNGASPAATTVRVGVAISLKEAMTEIATAYEKKAGDKIEFTFGSSGQILTQIEAGAPIDLFISAADKQVDQLEKAGLADGESRRVIAGNTLVLIVPKGSTLKIDSFESLAKVEIRKFAIGEPKTVPAGQYAAQTIEKLKLKPALEGKLVYGANVRQVLDYVIRDEVSAGVVYATDAKEAGEKVKVVATAPKESHDPIVYPAVIVKKSTGAPSAKKFLEHLGGEDAKKVLAARGFALPDKNAKKP